MEPKQNDDQREYELTDGVEVFTTRFMTYSEFVQANLTAARHTCGNVFWRVVIYVKDDPTIA